MEIKVHPQHQDERKNTNCHWDAEWDHHAGALYLGRSTATMQSPGG